MCVCNGRQNNTWRRWNDKVLGWQNYKSACTSRWNVTAQEKEESVWWPSPEFLPVVVTARPLFPSLPGWWRTSRVWALAPQRRSSRRPWPVPGRCGWGIRGSARGAFPFFVHFHVNGWGKISRFSTLPIAVAAAAALAGHQLGVVGDVLDNTHFGGFVKSAQGRWQRRKQRLRFHGGSYN